MAERELLEEASRHTGLIAAVAGGVSTAFGALVGIVYKKHAQEITDIKSAVGDKADKHVVEGELDRHRKYFTELFAQSRRDKEELLGEIRKFAETVHGIHTNLLTQINDRPTREEMTLYQRQKGSE